MPTLTSTIELPQPPERILLIKPSALGDIVNALPVLTGLKRLFPAAGIDWLVQSSFAELLVGHPHLNRLIEFHRRGWFATPWTTARTASRFLRELRQHRYDLVIDLQGLLRSGLMMVAARGKTKVGLAECREGANLACTHLLPALPGTAHAVDRYWRAVTALGGLHLEKEFILPVSPWASAWAERSLRGLPRPWLMLNLGTRWETKRWPVAHFADLAGRLRDRHGGSIILVGGPGEEPLGREFQSLARGGAMDCIGQTRLPQLTALLSHADLLITNDSGPMHLAAALNRPVLAPFTCTDPRRHGPYGQLHRAVATQVDCAASYLKRCPHRKCMGDLVPSRLLPLAETVLSSWSERCA